MAAALRSLPRRQREVLVLRYYLDLDVAEIADTLRISPSGVRATATRGLAALARSLREGEPGLTATTCSCCAWPLTAGRRGSAGSR